MIKPYTKEMQTRKSEPIKKIKKRLDAKYSRYVRLRDGLRCRCCGKQFDLYENNKGEFTIPQDYQCAHIIDRQAPHTRYKPENLLGLCSGCHIKFDGKWTIYGREKEQFRERVYHSAGITRDHLDLLEFAKKQTGQPDYTGLEMWVDAELAKIEPEGMKKL